jgi:hypothetical protein
METLTDLLQIPVFLLLTLLIPLTAQAVPSFARQTNLACAACHQRNFLELNSFGRQFKLSGYTMSAIKEVESAAEKNNSGLSLLGIPPLSAMFQVSGTHTQKDQPDQQNNNVAFPEQFSLFLAGRVAPDLGVFLQATYAQGDSGFSMDNGDIRYARRTKFAGAPAIAGLTLNNSPTVEDPWNSTPAWGFPWASSETAPSPEAATLIDGGLAQESAGLGGYMMWNNALYGNFSVYRSAKGVGAPTSSDENVIEGAAPYWRLAYQTTLGSTYMMFGTYGIYANLYPQGISGKTDRYTDVAVDTQIEQPVGSNLVTLHGTYIHEDQQRDASVGSGADATWSTTKLDGSYHFGSRLRTTLGFSNTETGADDLDSRSWIGSLDYFPWENVDLGIQYTAYSRFDGDTSNASDNNTLFLLGWLAF